MTNMMCSVRNITTPLNPNFLLSESIKAWI
jgi:hypothetical protein